MCLFTHFAAGALAGGLTGDPVWGAVAGIASHALLDMIPHYDHPDWRVEISGGAMSLLLLLALPVAGWPAVLGGVGGMLPDLENLFEKLGWYSRRRFIFPTHNGWLPHGRRLGPASLKWQLALFVACLGALQMFGGRAMAQAGLDAATPEVRAVLGRADVRVLQSTPDYTVLSVNLPVERDPGDWDTLQGPEIQWGDPPTMDDQAPENERFGPPRLGLTLAVPGTTPPALTVMNLRWWKEPQTGQDVLPVRVESVGIMRSVPLAHLRLEPGAGGGVLAAMTLRLDHPRAGTYAGALAAA